MSALDDLIADSVDAAAIGHRIDDWLLRLRGLYAQSAAWMPDGWSASITDTGVMHEELMKKAGVPPRGVPIMTMRNLAGEKASLSPKGLWIIGGNGTVDLRTPAGLSLITDLADTFEPPDWHIMAAHRRRDLVPLTEQTFRAAFRP